MRFRPFRFGGGHEPAHLFRREHAVLRKSSAASPFRARGLRPLIFGQVFSHLAHCTTEVFIPYAEALAAAIDPVAVRLRRDFSALLGLIKTHALLHRASRKVDDSGQILATIADYAIVRELIAGPMSMMVEATVDERIRETVKGRNSGHGSEVCGPG